MLFKGTGLGDRISGMFIPDHGSGFFSIPHPGSKIQKCTGSRIWIRNTIKGALKKKTRRGAYLLLELFIFAQIFAFYLVTQSLWPSRQLSGDQRA